MKSASITALFALALAGAMASAAHAATGAEDCEGRPSANKLTVQVAGVRAPKGMMVITVYADDAKKFLAPHSKLLRVRAVAQAPVTTACFWLPGPAYYAIAVYHDEDGDGKFNRTLVGLPTEGFAFSNDPPTPSALPPFKAVRFKAEEADNRIRVKLRYVK